MQIQAVNGHVVSTWAVFKTAPANPYRPMDHGWTQKRNLNHLNIHEVYEN